MDPYRQNQIMIGLLWLVGVGLTVAVAYFVFFVGGGGDPKQDATAARPPQDVPSVATREPAPTAAPALPPTELKVSVAYEPKFIWPAQGEITSTMGPEHPGGIDIGLSSGSAPIYAAADGRVAFAGGTDADDFGIHIIVDHGNSITTLYAHLSEMYVQTDDVVTQGKVIGLGGNTGHSTGKHVHFEVRGKEGSIDPMDVLPEGNGRTAASNLSCDGKPIEMERGASAVFDFQAAMLQRESVLRVEFTDPNAPATVAAAPQSRTRVKVDSTLELSATYEQSFQMAVTFQNGDTTRTGNCVVTVKTARVAPSFYVRASTPGSAGAGAPEEPAGPVCHPSYSGGSDTKTKGCIQSGIGNYSCYGFGAGPNFVSGKVRVVGADVFGLDKNRDGIGCDSLDR